MNTKCIRTVVCLALMSAISVSTVHAMLREKDQRPQKNVFEPFSNACKRFVVTAASDCVSSFVFTNVGCYVTKNVLLFSGPKTVLMPVYYCMLANSMILGLTHAYRNYNPNESYTKKNMQVDIVWGSILALQSVPGYVLAAYFLQSIHAALSHLR